MWDYNITKQDFKGDDFLERIIKTERKTELNNVLDFLATLKPEEYKMLLYFIEGYRAKAMIEKLH